MKINIYRNQQFNLKLSCLILLIALLLVSCDKTTATLPTENSVAQDTNTPLPTYTSTTTITITATPLSQPSKTPAPTKTRKPTETATSPPTTTPTFDTAGIITRTPAPPAQCPPENPNLTTDVSTFFNPNGWKLDERAMLDFLNTGGTPLAIISAFLQETLWFEEELATQEDITGDSVPEFIFSDESFVRVFGCKNGAYDILLKSTEADVGFLRYIKGSVPGDMNKNGVSELITNAQHGTMNAEHYVTIFEWDGEKLESIIQGESYWGEEYISSAIASGYTEMSTLDVDGNGTLELILSISPPLKTTTAYEFGLPWRYETHIYTWNGDTFLLNRVEYSPPEYRFQAVQDGDRASQSGDYDRAYDYYQHAISNDLLEWWSEERWSYEIRNLSVQPDMPPLETPIPDLVEYPNLSAYAHFRILLLHLVGGNISEAEKEFNTLKESFQLGQPGYVYVELATAFWEEYQKSTNIQDACAKAIEYVELYPVEVLSYLGNGEYARAYFGDQSLDYEPDSACPFR